MNLYETLNCHPNNLDKYKNVLFEIDREKQRVIDITRATGLTKPTVDWIIRNLRRQGIIKTSLSGRGRVIILSRVGQDVIKLL